MLQVAEKALLTTAVVTCRERSRHIAAQNREKNPDLLL
jgi:hypothetical protein